MNRAFAVVAGCLAVLLAGCSSQVPGSAIPALPPSVSDDSAPSGSTLPRPGQCTSDAHIAPLPCESPHTVEVVSTGDLGSAAAYPDSTTLRKSELPACYTALSGYLGSADFAATTLDAWVGWPAREQWNRGQRWKLCGVTELGADGKAATRTGALKNALTGNGFTRFQVCTETKASDQSIRRVPCDRPHVAESVPGVLALGSPDAPMPSAADISARAEPHCKPRVDAYLGLPDGRPDVFYAWRWPSTAQYANGNTFLVCFAQTQAPVSAPLRGIGAAPLPK
jgi:hypothetical protein